MDNPLAPESRFNTCRLHGLLVRVRHGGNILIRGKGATSASAIFATSDGNLNNVDGIRLAGSNTIISRTGAIDMQGLAQGTNRASNGIETNMTGYSQISSAATGTTAIKIYGDATAGSAVNGGWGTFLWGTHLEPNAFVLAANGPISLTGTKGATSTYEDVVINSTVGSMASLPAGFGIASPVGSTTSNITIAADILSASRIFGGGSLTGSAVQSSGTLALLPRAAGSALSIQSANPGGGSWINPNSMFGASGFFKTGFSKLTFGSATTGTVTLENFAFDNDTDLLTSGNAVFGAVNIASKTLTVTVTGGGSITDAGAIAVSKLKLEGVSSVATLATATNAIGTLAANVGSLSLLNNSALSIGTVAGTQGISATGLIDIATRSGDLAISQSISTTNTSANAITLNAGQDTAALTNSGGNILISASPTISAGTEGVIKFFSDSVSASTGLTNLVGAGIGRFRYASDVATTNYTASLSSGKNAIYRESFSITVNPAAYSSTYGATVTPTAFTASSGALQNGVSLAGIGSATITSTGTSSSRAGSYDLSASGLPARNSLGYALTGGDGLIGGHIIIKASLTVTAANASKAYNGLAYSGLVNGETSAVLGVLTYGGNSQGATAVGTYAIPPAISANNYQIRLVNGTLQIALFLVPSGFGVPVGIAVGDGAGMVAQAPIIEITSSPDATRTITVDADPPQKLVPAAQSPVPAPALLASTPPMSAPAAIAPATGTAQSSARPTIRSSPAPVAPSVPPAPAKHPPELKSMTPEQIRLVDAKTVGTWTSAMVQSLSANQLRALALAQISALRPDQIAALTSSQLIAMTRDQVYALSTAQLSALGKRQLGALNRDRTLLSKEKQSVLDKVLGPVAVPTQSAQPNSGTGSPTNSLLNSLRNFVPVVGTVLPTVPAGGVGQPVVGQPFVVYGN